MVEIGFTLGFAIYGILWFLTLFMVLPFGVQAQGQERVKGTAESAPINPHIGRKMFITTILAGVFYAGVYALLTTTILRDVVPLADKIFKS